MSNVIIGHTLIHILPMATNATGMSLGASVAAPALRGDEYVDVKHATSSTAAELYSALQNQVQHLHQRSEQLRKDASGNKQTLGKLAKREQRIAAVGIEPRLEYWRRSIEQMQSMTGRERAAYESDIILGQRILLARLREVDVVQGLKKKNPPPNIMLDNDEKGMSLECMLRTSVVKVRGDDVSRARVNGATNDFEPHDLTRVLQFRKQRNENIFLALEQHALRALNLGSDHRQLLKPTFLFSIDATHAVLMADAYAQWCVQPGTGLRGRRIAVLNVANTTAKDFDLTMAIFNHQSGESDAVVAVVSDETPSVIREKVLQAVANEKIEAVFSSGTWCEKLSSLPFSQWVGARPSFSMLQKNKELRCIDASLVQSDAIVAEPILLFDVVDVCERFVENLASYGHALGGEEYHRTEFGGVFSPRGGSASLLVAKLRKLIAQQYEGNVSHAARDIGLKTSRLEELLRGEGWVNGYRFLRRLATLMYLDRDELVRVHREGRKAAAFEKYGWASSAHTAQERLRLAARILTVSRYGDVLPYDETDINGVAQQRNRSPLRRWLLGEDIQFTQAFGRGEWYRQLRAFMIGLGMSDEAYQSLQVAAVFEERKWPTMATTAQESLLLEARKLVARDYGGVLSVEILNLPLQNEKSALQRWVRGEKIEFSKKLPRSELVRQLRVLLVDTCRMPTEQYEALQIAAVFEERGWSLSDSSYVTASEQVLFAARKMVALKFGGVLPNHTGIAGVPQQDETKRLSRWLQTGELNGFGMEGLWRQVRALLVGLGADPGFLIDLPV